MSLEYRAISWNRQKKLYDLVLVGGIVAYLTLFAGTTLAVDPHATAETIAIRAAGSGAFLLLHVILSIGPLCRLSPRFLPLLYNRRHLGVTMFLLAAVHGLAALVQFHALGDENPLVSLFNASARYGSLAWFPFQPLGLLALVILFLMAATSHDFWLANLSPRVWKTLHMGVYAAYALLVGHVALGVLQAETGPVPAALFGAGLVWVVGLHVVAGRRERAGDRAAPAGDDGWVDVGAVDAIPDARARVVTVGGERVAVFRHGGKLSAISNVCRHQNGPLGEGLILDGCITCPWHGYQYRPEDGCSPPPFTEKVETYDVRIEGDRVYVHSTAHPPGTPRPPAVIPSVAGEVGPAGGGA